MGPIKRTKSCDLDLNIFSGFFLFCLFVFAFPCLSEAENHLRYREEHLEIRVSMFSVVASSFPFSVSICLSDCVCVYVCVFLSLSLSVSVSVSFLLSPPLFYLYVYLLITPMYRAFDDTRVATYINMYVTYAGRHFNGERKLWQQYGFTIQAYYQNLESSW